jgi:hypothetical protein
MGSSPHWLATSFLLIPLIPFWWELQRIRETIETVPEDRNAL